MMNDKYKVYIKDELSLQSSSVIVSCLEGKSDNFILINAKGVSHFERGYFSAKKEDSISMCYFINEVCVYEFEGNLVSAISQDDKSQNVNFVIRTFEIPDLPLIMVLNSWVHGHDFLNWKRNKAKEIKELWLNACLYWKGAFPPPNNGAIEASLFLKDLYSYEDFFCMLGEAFFGFRGYMGKGFDSFYDCLSDLRANDVKVTLNGVQQSEHFLKKISPADINYYNIFINILTENDCIINN